MSRILKALFLCTLGLLALQARAREVDGVRYEENIELAGSKLQLNGAGTRYKAVFKVYTAGVCTSARRRAPCPRPWRSPGPNA
ncbi:MAG: chalcone isomerase family protein [Hylemonella sp.]|nr:chalcone isomerase family protein [Hylemonella sp.]